MGPCRAQPPGRQAGGRSGAVREAASLSPQILELRSGAVYFGEQWQECGSSLLNSAARRSRTPQANLDGRDEPLSQVGGLRACIVSWIQDSDPIPYAGR